MKMPASTYGYSYEICFDIHFELFSANKGFARHAEYLWKADAGNLPCRMAPTSSRWIFFLGSAATVRDNWQTARTTPRPRRPPWVWLSSKEIDFKGHRTTCRVNKLGKRDGYFCWWVNNTFLSSAAGQMGVMRRVSNNTTEKVAEENKFRSL